MKFSQRIGKKTIRETFQTDSMELTLRNRLWNTINKKIISPRATARILSSTSLSTSQI